jgi:regulator of protease activity HflC (stomatin/prohibitin superfamily)
MSIAISNDKRFANREVFIKNTHRGLWYEDGVLVRVLDAGRHIIPGKAKLFRRRPRVEVVLVDVRERELTIKGQEILTSDKVAIRVSIVVQFRVTDTARRSRTSPSTRTACTRTSSWRHVARWPA